MDPTLETKWANERTWRMFIRRTRENRQNDKQTEQKWTQTQVEILWCGGKVNSQCQMPLKMLNCWIHRFWNEYTQTHTHTHQHFHMKRFSNCTPTSSLTKWKWKIYYAWVQPTEVTTANVHLILFLLVLTEQYLFNTIYFWHIWIMSI